MHKDTKQLLKRVRKLTPLSVRHSGHHIQLVAPGGAVVSTFSATTSDGRAIKNMRADIRRAGYKI